MKRQRNRQENSLLKDLEDLESQEQLDLEMIEVKKESLEHFKVMLFDQEHNGYKKGKSQQNIFVIWKQEMF